MGYYLIYWGNDDVKYYTRAQVDTGQKYEARGLDITYSLSPIKEDGGKDWRVNVDVNNAEFFDIGLVLQRGDA